MYRRQGEGRLRQVETSRGQTLLNMVRRPHLPCDIWCPVVVPALGWFIKSLVRLRTRVGPNCSNAGRIGQCFLEHNLRSSRALSHLEGCGYNINAQLFQSDHPLREGVGSGTLNTQPLIITPVMIPSTRT